MRQLKKLSFIGVTHLSIVYGFVAASKGYKINFYDHDKKKFFFKNKSSIDEPGLNSLYDKFSKLISFSDSIADINKSEIIFIAPDIKTDSYGKSDNRKIDSFVKLTLKTISSKQILVILSQVRPGFTRKLLKKHNLLYYLVETLVFGNAVQRALNPERLIIGKNHANTLIDKRFSNFLKKFSSNVIDMNFESAELCKIAINIFLASSVTTSNFLNEISTKINANWDSIKIALNMDKRIGKFAYLEPGLGISGGNIERDLRSISDISTKLGVKKNLITTIRKDSTFYKDWVFRTIESATKRKNINYGILGLTYKENTNSIKNSPSIKLIKKLQNKNINLRKNIYVYDPKIKSIDGLNIIFLRNYLEVIKKSDVLIVMTKWDEFKKITKNNIDRYFKGFILIDTFQLLDTRIKKSNNYSFYSIKNTNF